MTVPSPLRITADELNCLIYSYFQDSGLIHSAFAVLHEGNLQHSPYLARHIPRGELVDLLGKALLYLEVEAHWNPDAVTTNCKAGFSLLEPHVCSSEASTSKPPAPSASTPSAPPASASANPPASSSTVKQPAQTPPVSSSRGPLSTAHKPSPLAYEGSSASHQASSLSVGEAGTKRKTSPVATDVPVEKRQRKETPLDVPMSNATADIVRRESPRQRSHGPGDAAADTRAVRLLPGHETEIFVCAWNPEYPGVLATGQVRTSSILRGVAHLLFSSKDSEVILWDLSKRSQSPTDYISDGRQLASLGKLSDNEQGDLTALHWNSNGTLLAIGSYDSVLRVATNKGTLWMTSDMHEGPIFATRFNKKGALLLTASLDGTTCVWDINRKRLHRQYHAHKDCCLDADWITDEIFASTGADKRVLLMHIDQEEPLKILEGHTEEVNQIRVNSAGNRLASCSDDGTTRIWKTDNLFSPTDVIPGLATSENVVILTGHNDPVSSIAWCPPTRLHKGHEILASSSFDKSARLWDSVTGECLVKFADHTRPVYTLTFSPDGRFLATGGADGWLYIYSMETYRMVYSWYAGSERPGVFELDWQQKGPFNRLALALEARDVMVLDCSKIPELQDQSRPLNGDTKMALLPPL